MYWSEKRKGIRKSDEEKTGKRIERKNKRQKIEDEREEERKRNKERNVSRGKARENKENKNVTSLSFPNGRP